MLNAVQAKEDGSGLKINITITNVTRINASNNNLFTKNNVELEDVTTICYPGSMLTAKGGSRDYVVNRIQYGKQAFSQQIRRSQRELS